MVDGKLLAQMHARLDQDWKTLEKYYVLVEQVAMHGKYPDDPEVSQALIRGAFTLIAGEIRTRFYERGKLEDGVGDV